MAVVNIEELNKQKVQLIKVPHPYKDGWIELEVKRVGLLKLISTKKIPNELLSVAYELMGMDGKQPVKSQKDTIKHVTELYQMMHAVAENIMVNPTYEEFSEHLMDDTLEELFSYAQSGVRALKSFREKPGVDECSSQFGTVQKKTKRNNKHK